MSKTGKVVPLAKYPRAKPTRVCSCKVQKWTVATLESEFEERRCPELRKELKAHSVVIPSCKRDMVDELIKHYKSDRCAHNEVPAPIQFNLPKFNVPVLPPLPDMTGILAGPSSVPPELPSVLSCTGCGAFTTGVCLRYDCFVQICLACGGLCSRHRNHN